MNWLKALLGKKDPEPERENSVTITKTAGSIYEVRIRGVLHKHVIDRGGSLVEHDIAAGANDLKALIILEDFKGWRKGDDWGDLDFFIRHGDEKIAKIAVVGEAQWKEKILIFLLAGQRRGEVRYFTPNEETQARAWLNQ